MAAEKARLAEAVTDGRLTQAEADEKAANAETRITDSLDDPIGRGHHGGPRGGDADDDATPAAPAPAESDAA